MPQPAPQRPGRALQPAIRFAPAVIRFRELVDALAGKVMAGFGVSLGWMRAARQAGYGAQPISMSLDVQYIARLTRPARAVRGAGCAGRVCRRHQAMSRFLTRRSLTRALCRVSLLNPAYGLGYRLSNLAS